MKDDAGNTYFVDFPLKEQLDANINSYIGLGLSIPIFNGWQVQTGIKNAKLNVKNYQYQLQLTKNTLYKEIQQAQADAVASLKKYIASTKAVTSVEESFRYTEQRYEAGIMNFVDYSTAKTRLKTKVLDFYSGQPITL
jgi:outer membrane protein